MSTRHTMPLRRGLRVTFLYHPPSGDGWHEPRAEQFAEYITTTKWSDEQRAYVPCSLLVQLMMNGWLQSKEGQATALEWAEDAQARAKEYADEIKQDRAYDRL